MNPSSYIRISHPAGLQHFVFICSDLQFVSYLLLLLVVCLVYKHTDCVRREATLSLCCKCCNTGTTFEKDFEIRYTGIYIYTFENNWS